MSQQRYFLLNVRDSVNLEGDDNGTIEQKNTTTSQFPYVSAQAHSQTQPADTQDRKQCTASSFNRICPSLSPSRSPFSTKPSRAYVPQRQQDPIIQEIEYWEEILQIGKIKQVLPTGATGQVQRHRNIQYKPVSISQESSTAVIPSERSAQPDPIQAELAHLDEILKCGQPNEIATTPAQCLVQESPAATLGLFPGLILFAQPEPKPQLLPKGIYTFATVGNPSPDPWHTMFSSAGELLPSVMRRWIELYGKPCAEVQKQISEGIARVNAEGLVLAPLGVLEHAEVGEIMNEYRTIHLAKYLHSNYGGRMEGVNGSVVEEGKELVLQGHPVFDGYLDPPAPVRPNKRQYKDPENEVGLSEPKRPKQYDYAAANMSPNTTLQHPEPRQIEKILKSQPYVHEIFLPYLL